MAIRIAPTEYITTGEEEGLPKDIYACVDHRASPVRVAEELNRLLKEHGLEIVSHESDSDEYMFSIFRM